MAKEQSPQVGYPDPIGARIRQRRLELGLSLSELAKKTEIRAPSHLHYIERGLKIPSEKIARSLARALSDDQELYVAWVRARQRGDVSSAMDATQILHDKLAAPRAEGSLFLASRPPVDLPGPALLLKVPVLPEGADPDDDPEPLEVLRLDPRLLGMEEAVVRPFAYRLGEVGAGRARDKLQAGDLALVTRSAWPIQRDEVYALRIGDRVALSRARWSEGVLWAVQGPREETAESLGGGSPPPALIGRVALVVRGSGRSA